MKKILSLILVALVMAFAGTAMAASVMDKDVLIVGTESTFKPFEFRSEKNEIVGFDIDMINIIADKLGKKVEIVDMAFDALIPSLLTGKIDVIAAGMSATAERAKRVTFSNVYYTTPDAFTVKEDNDTIKSVEDLKGKTAAVQLGTIQDAFLSQLKGVTVKRYQKTDDAFREVLLGRADFACVDGSVTKGNLSKNKDFTGKLKIAFFHHVSKTGMAYAVNKKQPELADALNKALAEVVNSDTYNDLKAKWGID